MVKFLIYIYIMNEVYIIINYFVDLFGDLFICSKLRYFNFIDSWEVWDLYIVLFGWRELGCVDRGVYRIIFIYKGIYCYI